MDDVDITVEHMERVQSASLGMICEAAAKIPEGKAGDCNYCGDWFKRVVEVKHDIFACGRCRDRHGLK